MNPYVLLVVFLAAVGGSFKFGIEFEFARQAREDQHIAEAVDAATGVVAKAIAGIRVNNTTIQQTLQKEIHEKPVYVDCRNTPDGLRAINAALEPPGNGKLPGADAAK